MTNFDKRLDEILAELVDMPVDLVEYGGGVLESKQAIRTLIEEEVIGSQDKREYWPVWKQELLERQRKIVGGNK